MTPPVVPAIEGKGVLHCIVKRTLAAIRCTANAAQGQLFVKKKKMLQLIPPK